MLHKWSGLAATLQYIFHSSGVDHWDCDKEFVEHLVDIFGHFAFHMRQCCVEVVVMEHCNRTHSITHVTVPYNVSVTAIKMTLPRLTQPNMVYFPRVS